MSEIQDRLKQALSALEKSKENLVSDDTYRKLFTQAEASIAKYKMDLGEMVTYHLDLQNSDNVLFLVRHAEKYIVNDFSQDRIQSITPNGYNAAKTLGIKLKNFMKQALYFNSSPVPRCIETAKAIISDMKLDDDISIMQALDADGLYVENLELARANFMGNNDSIGIFSNMLSGLSVPGMANVELATGKLLQNLCNSIDTHRGAEICVTHDSILALFVGTILECKFTKENWFDYLEGVAIKKSNSNNYLLYWGDQCFDVTVRCNHLLTLIANFDYHKDLKVR